MERKRLVSRPLGARRDAPAVPLPEPRLPGRPRSEAARRAILDAAIALIREVGYDALAMDAVAARAGVGKATVYRRWATKEALVVEALGRLMSAIPIPDTGTARGDLLRLLRSAEAMYRDRAAANLLSGLVAAMQRSAPIGRAVRAGFVASWRHAIGRVLERGIARGELPASLDLELATELVSGPLLHRLLITGARVDERFMTAVVDVVLRGLRGRK